MPDARLSGTLERRVAEKERDVAGHHTLAEGPLIGGARGKFAVGTRIEAHTTEGEVKASPREACIQSLLGACRSRKYGMILIRVHEALS